MNVYIIGEHLSGKTTVARALAEEPNYHYISGSGWLESTFRFPYPKENPFEFQEELFKFKVNRLIVDPYIVSDNILDIMNAVDSDHYVVDGLVNPKDFIHLFDYNEDVIVFLNRTDSPEDSKNYESIAINVIRDYCLYLATVGLLPREKWLEYNFKIPGEESDFVKQLGKHNLVTITRSINRAILHLKGELCKLQT